MNKVEMRGTGMLTVEDQLGKCYLQRDARPLQIYVCYGSVACSIKQKKDDLTSKSRLATVDVLSR